MPVEPPLYVLVHSPLVGSLTWSKVAEALARRGLPVVVPRLNNPHDPPVPLFRHHAEQVRKAVEAHSRTAPVVVVGHSGAGPLLPAVGETLVNAVAAYLFVDAGLPRDQARRLDDAPPEFARQIERLAARSGGDEVPPWAEWWSDDVVAALLPDEATREAFLAELTPLPRRLFDERLQVPPAFPDAPCGYLMLSRGYEDAAGQAARRGWPVLAMDAGHLHMLVDPESVAEAITELSRTAMDASTRLPDPVVAQRHRIAGWVDAGRRVGFGALAAAVVLFGVALYWDLPEWMVTAVVVCLAVASLSLLPSLIVGYGVAAAEREDDRIRPPPR